MIGIFDSGLGGLTVLRRVREALPLHDILFFADQAHVPYGDRATADLLRLLQHNIGWLDGEGVDAIVQGCNTSCAIASEFGWPPAHAPIVDIIESAAIAVKRGGFERVGVVATAATARSGAYARHIKNLVPAAQVFEVAAPALVPLVEAGKLHGEEPAQAVAHACAPLQGKIDAVLLGCTHYPLLSHHFETFFGPGVPMIDPAEIQAERAVELVGRRGIPTGSSRLECVTNGDLERFAASLDALIGDLRPVVRYLQPANG